MTTPPSATSPSSSAAGRRGVVTTACYIARIKGVRSAMPMFKALKLCPEATVVKGRMDVYVAVSKEIRRMMEDLTPRRRTPLSLDEAFLDLTGTARLHGHSPAHMLAKLANEIEQEIGITVSIGLSHNKFLAKVASDLDKPRGFSLIGAAETVDFLREKPVRLIWGIGQVADAALDKAGIHTFGDLLRWEKEDLHARFGGTGDRLWHLARGQDYRPVQRNAPVKSVSNETTFHEDTADPDILDGHIWRLSEKVSDRLKAKDQAGRVVTLKVKQSDHKILTRRQSLRDPTQIADKIYRTARELFDTVADKAPFRLLGVGLSEIFPATSADASGDLLDPDAITRAGAERAADRIRNRFGPDAIIKGRALR